MANTATRFRQVTARGLRVAETGKPLLQFSAACNSAASNSPGIGITVPQTDLPAVPTGADAFDYSAGWNWTLLTQSFANPNNSGALVAPVARTPQVGQVIGGAGYIARQAGVWSTVGSGGTSGNGAAPNNLGMYIETVTNPPNVNGQPDPDYPAPTVLGDAQLLSLAAGWVTV